MANQPAELGWMKAAGAPPFRYRYVYLSGGVNTGTGWETYNSPPGAYAGFYLGDSASINVIPVFSYYELCQSNGPNGPGNPNCYADNSKQDLTNLGDAGVMNAYFTNFKLLLDQIRTDGHTSIIHVEPDLWGYLERQGATASAIPAKVKTSGYNDVAVTGTADTAQGFACALLRLRDTYAPNALMAIHASPWATTTDISSSTDSAINAIAQADTLGNFLNSACISSNPFGGSTWDLVFNDLDDHDAGWWEVGCACINTFFTHWWDPNNVTFPNFSRYLTWVGELKVRTGRDQVAWQVPLGNQYFLTTNNTCNHYQDNVAQYFFAHPTNLFSAGIIAVLFGSGNGCQTTNTDALGDGVTNNGNVPTSDLLGFCNACNTHASTRSDDDGGFLWVAAKAYYTATVPAAPTGVTATPGNQAATVVWTAPAYGASRITGYRVTPFLGGVTAQMPQVFNSPLTDEVVVGLTNGSSYQFTIAAINSVGTGPDSAKSNSVTPAPLARVSILPALANLAYGGYLTAAYVQNVGTAPASMVMLYLDALGNPVGIGDSVSGLQPRATWTVRQDNGNSFGVGQAGSAILLSSQPVAAFVNEFAPGGGDATSYTGVSPGAGTGTTLYAPTIANGAYGGYTTGIGLVNTGVSATNVTVTYRDSAGNLVKTQNLNSVAAGGYQAMYSGDPALGLPAGFAGTATIQSSAGNVAAVVNEIGPGGQFSSFDAVPAGSATLFAPAILNNAYGGYFTGMAIQNTTGSAGTVTVDYFNGAGTATTKYFNIAASGYLPIYQGSPTVGSPPGAYAARITSTVPVAAIVNEVAPAGGANQRSTAYNMFPAGAAALHLPLVESGGSDGWSTGEGIMNTGAAATTVTVSYFDAATGAPIGSVQNQLLQPNAFSGIYQPTGGLPNGTRASAVVTTSPAGQVVAICNESNLTAFMSYSGQ